MELSFFSSFLLSTTQMFGVGPMPKEAPVEWKVERRFVLNEGEHPQVEMSSETIVEKCNENPAGFVKFPVLLYGAHEIYSDGHLLEKFGDPSFRKANFVLNAPVLECHFLKGKKSLTWKATAYSPYFARIKDYPTFEAKQPWLAFFGGHIFVGGAFAVLGLAVICWMLMFNKERRSLTIFTSGGMFCVAFYMIGSTAPFFHLDISMVNANKIADTSILLGVWMLLSSFYVEKTFSKFLYIPLTVLTSIGVGIILVADTGDFVQTGTSMPFTSLIFISGSMLYTDLRKVLADPRSSQPYFRFMFSAVFLASCLNEMLIFMGLTSNYTIMPLGMIASALALTLSVNAKINQTYQERDHLRANLENEVAQKTRQLTEAMHDLRETQGELVSAAKLASLGTLAAGIAHEINNSLNFVNGSLTPLERILNQLEPDPNAKSKKLIKMMKEGLELTFNIIKSLRNYTGLNQAKSKTVAVAQIVTDVCTILKAKIPDSVKLNLKMEEGLNFTGNVVGLNQVLMNLITNAIDAMPNGGDLLVASYSQGDQIVLSVKDSGDGIPEAIRAKIFDPFFTTKDVGKGTGLGLHIVRKEIERHGGRIELISELGKGTEFKLLLPVNFVESEFKQAA
jgi:signal transduction histidine kinase